MITDCLALVVDGNEDERNMYRLALEDAHLDIATASSLRDAYARFRHLRIEAVICDLDDWDRDAVYWPPLLEMIEPSAPTSASPRIRTTPSFDGTAAISRSCS